MSIYQKIIGQLQVFEHQVERNILRQSLNMISSSQENKTRRSLRHPTCRICLEVLLRSQIVNLGCHVFHSSCLDSYFLEQLRERRLPITCPEEKCPAVLPTSLIKHLEPKIDFLYMEHYLQDYISDHRSRIIFCPGADCTYWFEYTNCCKGKPLGKMDRFGARIVCPICTKRYCLCKTEFDCPKCGTKVCIKCKESHHGLTCEQHKWNKGVDSNFQKFVKYIRKEQFKRCPKCAYWVEKADGCNHMVCRCKYQFCYHCNGKYNQCKCHGNPEVEVDLEHIYPKVRERIRPKLANKYTRSKTLPQKNKPDTSKEQNRNQRVLPFWARWMKKKQQMNRLK